MFLLSVFLLTYVVSMPVEILDNYVGCYSDNNIRALSNFIGNVDSVQSCIDSGILLGYKYVGLQWNTECYGGDSGYDIYEKYSNTQCSFECKRNGESTVNVQCGGGWTNAVYKTSFDKTNLNYIGCYEDNTSRTLPNFLGDVDSVKSCIDLGISNNFNFVGVQWNKECYGGNDGYDKLQKYTDSKCSFECTGNGGYGKITNYVQCGGGWTNAIYKAVDSTLTKTTSTVTTTLRDAVTTTLRDAVTTTLRDAVTTTLRDAILTLRDATSTVTLRDAISTTLRDAILTTTLRDATSTVTLRDAILTLRDATSTVTLRDAISTTLRDAILTTTLRDATSTSVTLRDATSTVTATKKSTNSPDKVKFDSAHGMVCGGAIEIGAKSVLNMSMITGGAYSSGANSKIIGDVDAIGAVSTGAKSIFFGNIKSQAAVTIGANSDIKGNIEAVGAVTLGADASIIGNILTKAALTTGARSIFNGDVLTGIVSDSMSKIVIDDVERVYKMLMSFELLVDFQLSIVNDVVLPGLYTSNSAYFLSVGKTLVFKGNVDDVWIIRIKGAMSLSGNIRVEGGLVSNIYWISSGAASVGANSKFSGRILSLAAISIGANSDVDGGMYSINGACSVGAKVNFIKA